MRNEFGERLFSIFFKTYTEKVWGMGCDEISADWAAQRIKGLNLSKALINGLGRSLGLKPRPAPERKP
jgi:protoporphyrinogen oxidase